MVDKDIPTSVVVEDSVPIKVETQTPLPVTVTNPEVLHDTASPILTPSTATPGEVIQQQSTSQDYTVLRIAVVGLMLTILVALGGVILLAYQGKEAPDGIIAAGSAAIGALATMIVRPPLFPVK